jgi:aldehyde:ferredoxin oxidoreductase
LFSFFIEPMPVPMRQTSPARLIDCAPTLIEELWSPRPEDCAAVLDSMIVCKFSRKCFTDFYSEGGELLSKVTGWNCSGTELRRIGERIHTLKKLFNMREGWRSQDDWLPERLQSRHLFRHWSYRS